MSDHPVWQDTIESASAATERSDGKENDRFLSGIMTPFAMISEDSNGIEKEFYFSSTFQELGEQGGCVCWERANVVDDDVFLVMHDAPTATES